MRIFYIGDIQLFRNNTNHERFVPNFGKGIILISKHYCHLKIFLSYLDNLYLILRLIKYISAPIYSTKNNSE